MVDRDERLDLKIPKKGPPANTTTAAATPLPKLKRNDYRGWDKFDVVRLWLWV